MWEYVGTLFACAIAATLGYVFGRIKEKQKQNKDE